MNDPTYVEAARNLAEKMMTGGQTFEARLQVGFARSLARAAGPAEREILSPIYQDALARFAADREGAKKLLAVGASPRDMKLDDAELAAWTTIASMILDMDETITKE